MAHFGLSARDSYSTHQGGPPRSEIQFNKSLKLYNGHLPTGWTIAKGAKLPEEYVEGQETLQTQPKMETFGENRQKRFIKVLAVTVKTWWARFQYTLYRSKLPKYKTNTTVKLPIRLICGNSLKPRPKSIQRNELKASNHTNGSRKLPKILSVTVMNIMKDFQLLISTKAARRSIYCHGHQLKGGLPICQFMVPSASTTTDSLTDRVRRRTEIISSNTQRHDHSYSHDNKSNGRLPRDPLRQSANHKQRIGNFNLPPTQPKIRLADNLTMNQNIPLMEGFQWSYLKKKQARIIYWKSSTDTIKRRLSDNLTIRKKRHWM